MLQLENGASVSLGAQLAKAGEGVIFDVAQHPNWVAKIFHPTLPGLEVKREKVKAMATAPPPGVVQPNGFVVLTWPQHVIFDRGTIVGYVMPKIDTDRTVEIHALTNPTSRKSPHPKAPQWPTNASWKFLLNVAGNLCLAVETVHKANAVIGDFQERNILVSDTSRVTLVDCDSMQFTERSGRTFGCHVGRPEFSAPEVCAGSSKLARKQSSDLFALAIHIHLLLMEGNHPFSRGTWSGTGDQPSISTLVHKGHWAGGPGSPLVAHPLAPRPAMLPGELQNLFIDAFTRGAANPAWRPTASRWRQTLMKMDAYTTKCMRDPSHVYPANNSHCPWCALGAERGARRAQAARRRPPTRGAPAHGPGRIRRPPSPPGYPPSPLPVVNVPTRPVHSSNTVAAGFGYAVMVILVCIAILTIFVVAMKG